MTSSALGLIAAFVAFLAWGLGDFAIQRSVRAVGNMAALFAITAFGAVVLLPWAWPDIPTIFSNNRTLNIFLLAIGITLVTALLDFEALKRGKMAVIEPVMSTEVVITMAIGVVALREHISIAQLALVLAVFFGIVLTVVRHEPRHWWTWWRKARLIEQGVILAGLGAIAMSLTNVYTGLFSQATNAVTAIWFIHASLAAICLVWFVARRETAHAVRELRDNWKPVLAESVLDNSAWVAYAAAVTVLPISITIAITESYIVLASLLGIVFNREKVQRHQAVGMGLTLASAVVLAVVTA